MKNECTLPAVRRCGPVPVPRRALTPQPGRGKLIPFRSRIAAFSRYRSRPRPPASRQDALESVSRQRLDRNSAYRDHSRFKECARFSDAL